MDVGGSLQLSNVLCPQIRLISLTARTYVSVAMFSVTHSFPVHSLTLTHTHTLTHTATSRLVSATPLDHPHFGIVMSNSPYDGSVHVGTRSNWFDICKNYLEYYMYVC